VQQERLSADPSAPSWARAPARLSGERCLGTAITIIGTTGTITTTIITTITTITRVAERIDRQIAASGGGGSARAEAAKHSQAETLSRESEGRLMVRSASICLSKNASM
jgi:ribosomal protein S9